MNFKSHYDVIVILILISVLISCGKDEKKQAITVPVDAQAGSVYLEPDIYTVDDKEFKSHSGIIVVPENRSKLDSRLIEIPIVQIHAMEDSVAEPIFYLNGGPGNSNILPYRFINDLIKNHDIVLVGYRGVDGSVVLNCPEVDEFFSNLPGDLTEQATLDSMASAYSRCASRVQREGVDTDGYTMTEVIQDFEDTRIALGYNRINLLSASYGTRLSQIYTWMYAKSIHRSVMIRQQKLYVLTIYSSLKAIRLRNLCPRTQLLELPVQFSESQRQKAGPQISSRIRCDMFNHLMYRPC